MIDQGAAATEIRRLSRLKNYPRSWENAGDSASEQDAQAESALIAAAAAAPDLTRLRRFVSDWERRHVEAPAPAVLYEAWRLREQYSNRRERGCAACGDSGYITRHYVSDAINGKGRREDRIYINAEGEALRQAIDDWWKRIRETPTCAQRVYSEAVRCGCNGGASPDVRKDVQADAGAWRDYAQKAAGDLE